MTTSEEKDLLQQITFLSRLITRHKNAANPCRISPMQQVSKFKLTRKEPQTKSTPITRTVISNNQKELGLPRVISNSRLSKPNQSKSMYISQSYLNSEPSTSHSETFCKSEFSRKILVNPNFKPPDSHNVVCANSVPKDTSYERNIGQCNEKKEENIVKPKTILINPNFKRSNSQTSVHINSKFFGVSSSLPVQRDLSRENDSLANWPCTSQSESISTIKPLVSKSYTFKSKTKLVCQASKGSVFQARYLNEKSQTPYKNSIPFVSLSKTKLVRTSLNTLKLAANMKHKSPARRLVNNYKYKCSGRSSQTYLRSPGKSCTVKPKYSIRQRSLQSSPKSSSVSKFKVDHRICRNSPRVKNVKKYSLKYELSSTQRRRSWQGITQTSKRSSLLINSRYRLKRKPSQITQSDKASCFTIGGHKFVMDSKRKSLKRIIDQPDTPVKSKASWKIPMNKIHIGGKTYAAKSPNVFVRTNDHAARTFVSQAKNKSISVLVNKLRKNNQPCLFYQRFGKCIRLEKGNCPCVHDSKRVAICKKFLQGRCELTGCLLSHDVGPNKMPTCQFFLLGLCTKDKCPYLHVKVNSKAEICLNFLKGYCTDGERCKKRHVNICPEFEQHGSCPKGKFCPYPHKASGKKPLRKGSAPQQQKKLETEDVEHDVAETTRYYVNEEPSCSSQNNHPPKEISNIMEENCESSQECVSTELGKSSQENTKMHLKRPKLGNLPPFIPI